MPPTSPSSLPGGLPGDLDARSAAGSSGLVSSYETKCPQKRVHRGEKRISRLRKALPIAAQQIAGQAHTDGFRTSVLMLCLTYREDAVWEPGQIRDFQSSVAKWLERRQIPYRAVWVIELTLRGRPHYHVLLWLPRAKLDGRTLPKPDVQGWWSHGLTRREWAKNPIGYLVKYSSKCEHHHKFPHGARLFGVRGLTGGWRRGYRLQMLPYWLKDIVGHHCLCRRLSGGWWATEDGELLQSPWMIVRRAADWSWIEFGPRLPGWIVEVVR